MNEGSDADAQGGAHLLKHQTGGFVPLAGKPVDLIGGESPLPSDQLLQFRAGPSGIHQFRGAPHHGRCRCISFQATTVAAVAQTPLRPNVDVAQLGGHPLGPVPDLAIQDQPAANAGTQGQKGQVFHIFGHPHPLFSQSRGIGIVFQGKGGIHLLADPVANIKTGPTGQVGSRNDQALGELHDAGHRHANAGQSVTADPAVPQLQDGTAHATHDIFRALAGIGRQFQVLQQVAIFPYGSQLQVGSAQVDSNGKALHAIRPVMAPFPAGQAGRRLSPHFSPGR